MTNLKKEQVQTATAAAIPAYCKAKGISANELATKAGVSAATISQMKNGNWDNIDSKLWKKVWNVVNPETLTGIITTGDCKLVFDECSNAIAHKRMIGITGDTGMGKTTACRAFAVRPNVYYYYIDSTVTPKIFLRGLLKDMGISYEGSVNDMLTRVAEELNTTSDPLLIIDECGKMRDKLILLVHSLRDKTMTNCGMVLAGMPDFKDSLIKKVNRQVTGYSEFFRRVNRWCELKGLTGNEITFILEANGITDKEVQREYRKKHRFGDLMNEILFNKTLND